MTGRTRFPYDDKAREVTTTDELGTAEVPLPPYPIRAIPLSSNVELRYEVAAGRVLATIAGLARTYRAGEIFIVPPGVVHALEAVDDERPRLLRHLASVPSAPAVGSTKKSQPTTKEVEDHDRRHHT